MNEHPTPSELEGFVWSRISLARARDVVAHLVRGCETCVAALAPHWAGISGWADPPEPVLVPRQEAEYEAALDRAFASALSKLREERPEALYLFTGASGDELPEVPAHLRGVPLFEALLERSWSLRHESPEEMIKVAEWARVLAEQLDPNELGTKHVADLQCRAWISLGNAYRVADDLHMAETALGRAAQLLYQGTEDELLVAKLFDVEASLLAALRRFDLAATALDLVFAIHHRRGDKHLAGRSLISQGIYIGYQGKSEKSVRLIEQGLKLLDEARDPRLVQIALQSLGRFLMDCGRLKEARAALWKAKAYGPDAGGRLNELKVRWLEAQINLGLGELERAEAGLIEVRSGFEEANLPYKSALAGLELGLVMLHRGRPDAAAREVLAAVQVFYSLGIAREVNASVLLLRKAIEQDMLEIKLLEYVIEKLREAEEAPGGPFEPPAGE